MRGERKIVTATPENSETPLESVASWVTPNRLFFVRNHFNVPDIDSATWELVLDGLVDRSLRWSLAELAAMPQHSVFATVECAGNGRSFLGGKYSGVQWGAGAIGHAEWTGVRVLDLLERAGLKLGALEVIFEGADRGEEHGHPEPMNFSRSLPLGKALDPDTLIALCMNGEWLEANHGAPARLLVPGWYGVASVKWLTRMTVIDTVYQGYFQTVKYTVDRLTPSGTERVPLGAGSVKSEIVSPRPDDILGLGTNRVAGIAWAGEQRIARVDLSTDGGCTWVGTKLTGLQQPYSWCHWEYLWPAATPGSYRLCSRAYTTSGEAQPFDYDAKNLGYAINFMLPRKVQVSAASEARATYADASRWLYDMDLFAEENTRRPLDVELAFTAGDGI